MLINASYCPAENGNDMEVFIPHFYYPNVSAHTHFCKDLVLVVTSLQSFDTIVEGAGGLSSFEKSGNWDLALPSTEINISEINFLLSAWATVS